MTKVHPIEHLRYMARSHGADPVELALGTADALSGVANDPAAMLVSARRLVEHHPTNAQLWSVCAVAVTDMEPRSAVRQFARDLSTDSTSDQLVAALPADGTVCVVGWSGHVVDALVRRGDLHALVVDSLGDGQDALRVLSRNDVSCELIAPEGMASAAEEADITLVSALAVGDDAVLAAGGSLAVASVAYCAQKPVWLVAGFGTRLPQQMFNPMVDGVRGRPDPWASGHDIVPVSLASQYVGPGIGPVPASMLQRVPPCPVAVELLHHLT